VGAFGKTDNKGSCSNLAPPRTSTDVPVINSRRGLDSKCTLSFLGTAYSPIDYIQRSSNENSPSALRNGVFAMNPDGSGLTHLAPLSKFHHDLYPSYSPDGTKIAFVSDRFSTDITEFTYGTFDIVTMNVDGSNLTDVAPGVGFCPDDGNCVDALWGANP
jgi:hypothetical protein